MDSNLSAKAKEIAEELDMGFRAFIHKTTGALIFVPSEDDLENMEADAWEEELKLLKKQRKSYEEIEKWSSSEAFNMMRDFTEQLTTAPQLKNNLAYALNNRKPFGHFMAIIHDSGEYRDQWFDYKLKWQMEFVAKQLEVLGIYKH